ncbi:hypothetical protein [Lacticaseibacillus manihotivorans]|uniref:hypothetical protein n=1 Tax=Lacticaseibacillus manihotivorans TaxID=88233 RepID=UPI000AB3C00B
MVYRTIQQNGEAEMIIKKSRFITHLARIQSEADAQAFIADIKKKPITKPITTSQFIYSVTMTTFNAPMMTANPVVQPACPC